LADRVSNCEDRVDLVELVAFETQLFSHTRNICVVEIGAIKVVEKVHEAAEAQDEKIELLHQLALSWRILVASQIGNELVRHVDSMAPFGGETVFSDGRTACAESLFCRMSRYRYEGYQTNL
jgi:hypothetical protein